MTFRIIFPSHTPEQCPGCCYNPQCLDEFPENYPEGSQYGAVQFRDSPGAWQLFRGRSLPCLLMFTGHQSVLAIFIQTLLPSHWQWAWSKPPPYAGGKSRRTIIARRVKRPVPRPVASPTSSFLRSTRSHETIRSSMVDGAVPQSHARVDLPASLMPATKLPIQRTSHGEVSKAHRIFKRHTLPASPSVNSCRTIASLKQRSTHLKGRNSTGSFCKSGLFHRS